MNLHLVSDNSFVNRFAENLQELGILERNKIVVRTHLPKLAAIRRNVPFGRMYSSELNAAIGDTRAYEKVFIHYFSPLLYRWAATNTFRELNWMVWGGDLYNLPGIDPLCYEPLTRRYLGRQFDVKSMLLNLKVLAQIPFRRAAYRKVNGVLTWMTAEYDFARKHLSLDAAHRFFFYENQVPYHQLPAVEPGSAQRSKPVLLLGNSGTPTNNHMDAVRFLEDTGVAADLIMPVSYGDSRYVQYLRRHLRYTLGQVTFIDRRIPFDEYVRMLHSIDGLVMNTIRPQGYGTILMMIQMGKPVFMNTKNVSLPDLDTLGIPWLPMERLATVHRADGHSLSMADVQTVFSHDRALTEYATLFA